MIKNQCSLKNQPKQKEPTKTKNMKLPNTNAEKVSTRVSTLLFISLLFSLALVSGVSQDVSECVQLYSQKCCDVDDGCYNIDDGSIAGCIPNIFGPLAKSVRLQAVTVKWYNSGKFESTWGWYDNDVTGPSTHMISPCVEVDTISIYSEPNCGGNYMGHALDMQVGTEVYDYYEADGAMCGS